MDLERLFEVFRITLPVFALMGVGKYLQRKGIITVQYRQFLSNLTYYLALPSLIYVELASQPFGVLINPVLIIGTIVSIIIVTVLFSVLVRLFRIKGGHAAAVVFGTFWANVSYMGFPLASGAFGEDTGVAMGAIVNAFAMPLFFIIAFILIVVHTQSEERSFRHATGSALLNPVVLAAFFGLFTAFIISHIPRNTQGELPFWLVQSGETVRAFLKLIGAMGLPLALLAVGASLESSSIKKQKGILLGTIAGKLFLMPLITLVIIKTFFPDADQNARGVAVLLMATPAAVASYVIAGRHQVAESFVSSVLVFSTMGSIVTIPLWLYFLL